MEFKVKIQGKQYEVKSLKMGEARALKQNFGMSDFGNLSLGDPDVLAGFAYLCFQREDPRMTHTELMTKVDALDLTEDFSAADEPDPTPVTKPRAKRAATGS